MKAIVLSIGSELLRGDIVDTNAAFLAQRLSRIGFEMQRVVQVGDDLPALQTAVAEAWRDADLTVATGGLGPTQDDLTRQAIANALGEEATVDEAVLETIAARFAAMKRPMAASNRQQALLIPSAQAIPNPNGTAPGWFVRKNGRIIVAMPGPPQEMQPMWERIEPEIASLLPDAVAMRTIVTFGIGESALEEQIADIIAWRPDLTVATYAKPLGVEVHVTARAATAEQAEMLAGEAVERLRTILGSAIVGEGDTSLSGVVGTLLLEVGGTLAVMESCTGGELANLLTDTPGSSEYFLGGVVAYTREAKALAGVSTATMDNYGLISRQTAKAMAIAAAQYFGAQYGLGVTGIAGEEPVEGKPPGTVFVALHAPHSVSVQEIHRPGPRSLVKRYAAQTALSLLVRSLTSTERQPA